MNEDLSVIIQAVLEKSGITKELSEIQKIVDKNLIEIKPKLETASLKNNLKEVSNLIADSINKAYKNVGNVDFKVTGNDVFKILNQIEKQAETTAQKLNKIQHSFANGDYEAKVESTIAKTQQWRDENGNARISTEQLRTALANLGTAYNNLNANGGDTIANQKALKQAESELSAEIKRVTNEVTKMNAEYAKSSKVESLHQKLTEFYDKNSATHKKWGTELKQMMDATASGAKVTNSELLRMELRYKEIGNKARQAGKLGLSFFDSIKEQAKKFTQWVSVASIVTEGVQTLRKMKDAVYDIDTAMTELAKVSDSTRSRLNQSLNTSIDTAKELGATVSDVVSATADWSRLGYNMDDAEKLAKIATIYTNVGDGINMETANKSLISTLQGFNKTADEAMHVIDSFNEVANNFAIDSDGIGQALQRSASSMSAAGNTMEQTIGLITAANTVVQDPESVGTAFKTISMRIRGAKTELEEMGEDTDGMVESTAKLQQEIKALSGVDIMKDKNTFKSTYEILDELSQKWKDLTDIQRASITELIAGKRQGNIISALMSNFDTARQATETAINSQGSALREEETYLTSLEAKTKQFQAAFQSLSETFLGSNILKFFVDLGTTGVKALDALISKIGSLGTIGLGAGIFAGFKNVGINTLVAY